MRDADIVVITAGSRRIAGENVHNHIAKNVQVFRPIIAEINKRCANAIILVVSNPVDSMTYVAWKLSGAPSKFKIIKKKASTHTLSLCPNYPTILLLRLTR